MKNHSDKVSKKIIANMSDEPMLCNCTQLSAKAKNTYAAVSAEACDMIMRTAFTHSANLPFLFETAVELKFATDKPIRSGDFYEGLGALFGKSGAATRRCMNYSRFEYERCREEIKSLQDVSEKAFSYMQAEDIIQLFCDELKRRGNRTEE